MQSIRADQRDDATKKNFWLNYWIIYGLFSFFEMFFSWFLYMIPGFTTLRFFFFVALIVPETFVCSMVYNSCVLPVVKQY